METFDSTLVMQHVQERLSVQPAVPKPQVLRYLGRSAEDNKYAYQDTENHLFFSGVDNFLRTVEASAPSRINRSKSRLTSTRNGDEVVFEVLDEYASPIAFQIIRAEDVAIDTVIVDSTDLDNRRSARLSAEALHSILSPGPGLQSTLATNLESFVLKASQLLAALAAAACIEDGLEAGQVMSCRPALGSSIRSRRAEPEEVTRLIMNFRQSVDDSIWLVDPVFVDDLEMLRRSGAETGPTDIILDNTHLLRHVRDGQAVYRLAESSLERVTPVMQPAPEVGHRLVFGTTKAGQRLMYNLETRALISHAPEPAERPSAPPTKLSTTLRRNFI